MRNNRIIEANHVVNLMGDSPNVNNRLRRCHCKECNTILSKYNMGDFCFAHSPVQTYLSLLEEDELAKKKYVEKTKITTKKVSTKVKENKSWKRK